MRAIFFFTRSKFAQRLVELLARVRVLDRQSQDRSWPRRCNTRRKLCARNRAPSARPSVLCLSGREYFPSALCTSRSAKRPVAVPRIPSFGMRASSISKPGMSGVTRNAVIAVLPDSGHRRARHHGEHLRDRGVGDVALLAIQNVMRAVLAGRRLHLHVGRVRAGFPLGERESAELLASSPVSGSHFCFCSCVPKSSNARIPIE